MESDLSHCLLMRQAAQVAVDSVTRIVTETCSAYEDYQCEYRYELMFGQLFRIRSNLLTANKNV